jgi:hypothetical protein
VCLALLVHARHVTPRSRAGRGERLGLGAHSQADAGAADLGDVYSSYRKLRSTSYHQMILAGSGAPPQGGGG